MASLDPTLGEISGEAEVLTAGSTSGTVVVGAGPPHHRDDQSPTLTLVTVEPIAITSPRDSCPITRSLDPGGGVPYSKAQISLSVPQTPASIMRSFTSVGDEIAGSGKSMMAIFFLGGSNRNSAHN
jgi:hypothetical protein